MAQKTAQIPKKTLRNGSKNPSHKKSDSGIRWLVGIDEVGRGPLAGPVVVCAFKVQKSELASLLKRGLEVTKCVPTDSKKMNQRNRRSWYDFLNSEKRLSRCQFYISKISAQEIDKFGIAPSIHSCVKKCTKSFASDCLEHQILLDGGLRAPEIFVNQKTIIKGDFKELVISLASIVAKVYRDSYMVKISEKYPHYGFEKNVGYGTQFHRDMIAKVGVTNEHRLSFLKNILK